MKTINLAIVAALLCPMSAEAAVTVTNYSFAATFDTSRPVQLIEGSLATSYDDQTRKLSLTEFYADVNGKAFYLNQVGAFGPNTQFGIGGIAFGGPENLASDSEDFIAAFSVANGRLTALTSFAYSYNGGADVGSANSLMTTLAIIPDEVEDLPVAAVPEPATWAMMLVGFGMVGATARYRRRGAKVTYA
jgi:hypothetical protein